MTSFSPGDIVRHTAKFLRNTGQWSAPIDGLVISVKDSGYFKGSPVVTWSDDETETPTLILAANVELVQRGRTGLLSDDADTASLEELEAASEIYGSLR
jgi:hypothetical protein